MVGFDSQIYVFVTIENWVLYQFLRHLNLMKANSNFRNLGKTFSCLILL